jgi:hypothetical protein
MNEFSTWVQENWYELGNLLSQVAFLIGAIWFGKKILTTLRASQEQVGALLKLSVTAGTAERQNSPVIAEKSPQSEQLWMTASETQAVSETLMTAAAAPKLEVAGPGRLQGVVNWLKTPMSSAGHHPLRRAKHWLQSPAGNH